MLERITSLDDILPGILWLAIILFFGYYQYQKKGGKLTSPYYITNLYFKIVMAMGFVISYAVLYNGGDTEAYFECSEKLNHLFFESPSGYFDEIFSTPSIERYRLNFNAQTGYPPGWIYKEPESFFVAKILSFISFFTFNSYWGITMVLASISSIITYNFYEFVKRFKIVDNYKLALCLLFLPSVAFWCTGISKDTIVFLAILAGIMSGMNVLIRKKKILSLNTLVFILSVVLLSQIRTFLLLTLLIPLFMSMGVSLSRRFNGQTTVIFFFRTLIVSLGLIIIIFYTQFSSSFGSLSPEKILAEAAVTQQDFAQNKTYGTDRYELNITDYSFGGMLRVSPQAIIAGVYRPFPWEARKISVAMNLVESLILLILSVLFFIRSDLKARVFFIRKYELLIFALFFTLILAFMTGFSSGLYGVLVRLRAPLLPFIFLFFVAGIWGLKHQEEIKEFKN